MKNAFVNSVFYKNRHLIGFFAVAIILYFFIVMGFARTPVGLSAAEMDTALLSAGFNFPDSIIGLPFHFLQWLSINVFGLSTFSLRLPSVILALLTSGLIIMAIRNFTRSNVAIITGLFMLCSVFFLNFARSGTPEIMGIFLMSLVIFAISQIIRRKPLQTLWLALLAIGAALAVYMPGGIAFLIIGIVAMFISSKSRKILFSLKLWQVIAAGLIGVAALTPLVLSIVANSNLLWETFGIDGFLFAPKDILNSLQAIFSPFGAEFGGYVTPILSFGEIALAILGIIKLIRDGKSARAAFVLSMAGAAIMLSIFSPSKSFLLFIPWVFLMAFGVAFIIDHWYKLFPLNPYARVLGLIPIGLFVFAMILSGRGSYLEANYYDTRVVSSRNVVFEAARSQINTLAAHQVNLVVPDEQLEFYRLLEKSYPSLMVSSQVVSSFETQILIPGTYDQKGGVPTNVVANSQQSGEVLLKIYQKSAKLD